MPFSNRSKLVTFHSTSRVFNVDDTVANWNLVREPLAEYLRVINSTDLRKIAPDISGMYEFYRRQVQINLFSELGIRNTSSSYGVVLNPDLKYANESLDDIALPVRFIHSPDPDVPPTVVYSTLEYATWSRLNDKIIFDGADSVQEPVSKNMIPKVRAQDLDLVIDLLEPGIQWNSKLSPEQISLGVNDLFLATIRKYTTDAGPHFFNMPMIQATFFDTGLNPGVYKRYILRADQHIVGYFLCEVGDDFFTISHALIDHAWLKTYRMTVKVLLQLVLRHMMSTLSLSRRYILTTNLLRRYLKGRPNSENGIGQRLSLI